MKKQSSCSLALNFNIGKSKRIPYFWQNLQNYV